MAKQLKAIQCPTCGSPQKNELRPATYRCLNCGTEYFLDSDDITIYVRQVPPGPAARPAAGPLGWVRWALIVLMLGVLGSLAMHWVQRQRSAGPDAGLEPDPIMTGRIEQPEVSAWRSAEAALVPGAGGQPVLVLAGAKTTADQQAYTATVAFYDARTGAVQQELDLPGGPQPRQPTVELERLSDGTVLVVANNAAYQVQAAPPAVPDITARLLANQPTLASGVASLDRGPRHDDAVHVFTNDGHNLSLYPLTRRVYTDNAAWDAARGFGTLRPGSPVRTGFAFSEASSRYPEEPIQLIRYQYKYNGGGPQAKPTFSWDDDYGGSGIFTSADPHEKRLIRRNELALGRVLSYRDFTPGRQYFYPALLLHDADYVLLTFQATAGLGSQRFVQALDARTAAIRFTTPLPAEATAPSLALRYPGGFVIGEGHTTYTLSPAGALGPAVTCQ